MCYNKEDHRDIKYPSFFHWFAVPKMLDIQLEFSMCYYKLTRVTSLDIQWLLICLLLEMVQ